MEKIPVIMGSNALGFNYWFLGCWEFPFFCQSGIEKPQLLFTRMVGVIITSYRSTTGSCDRSHQTCVEEVGGNDEDNPLALMRKSLIKLSIDVRINRLDAPFPPSESLHEFLDLIVSSNKKNNLARSKQRGSPVKDLPSPFSRMIWLNSSTGKVRSSADRCMPTPTLANQAVAMVLFFSCARRP